MSLKGLRTALGESSSYSRVGAAASHPAAERTEELQISAVSGLRPALLADIAENLRTAHDDAVVLAVTATDREAEELASSLAAFAPQARTAHFPSWETLPHERLSPRSDTVGRRLAVLRHLADPREAGGLDVVVAPVRAVIQPIVEGLGDLQPVVLTRGGALRLRRGRLPPGRSRLQPRRYGHPARGVRGPRRHHRSLSAQ